MAAGDSKTGIANLALAMLSEDPIDNVDPPDDSKAGRLCAQFYDSSRRAMLTAAPWRCAKRQFAAAAAATPPQFTYGAAYPVPADYLRMYRLPEEGGRRWEIMNLDGIGVCVVSDAGAPLDEEYIFDLQDPTQMDALLVRTIAADMAVWMALPMTRDLGLKNECAAEREANLALARSISSQQASPRQFAHSVLLASRR